MYRLFGKRLLDLLLTIPALVLLSPVFAVLAVIVRLKLGGPVIFQQQRPGRYERLFTIYKFRTMTDAKNAQGDLLHDAERLTPIGRFLRSTSLDELPELWNVLKGEMSLVGPRPLLVSYLRLYSPEQARRHEVRPGITGWAQVNGRQSVPFSERFDLDIWYVDNLDMRLDIKILFMTFAKAFIGRDVISGQDVSEVDDLGFHSTLSASTKLEEEQ